MNGPSVLRYLKEIYRQFDQGQEVISVRKLGATLVIPAAALLPSCIALYAAPAYGVPFPEEETNCTDGYDDDYDGLVDCDDSDCRLEVCLGCFDGIDNDGENGADCTDPTCAEGEGCLGLCDDGLDNDEDGHSDCDDHDCAGSEACP
jgi:hypothetical protein